MLQTVAIVINTSWNIYNFRLGLLQALRNEGYRIIAIAPTDSYVDKLIALGFECHHISINSKGTNPIEDLKLIKSFYTLYNTLKPDILLHYTIKPNIYGAIAARLCGIPVINNISGLGAVFMNNRLSSKIAKLLYKLALGIPEKVFFQNHDDRTLLINLKLLTEQKTDVLPGSGVDTVKFCPMPDKRRKKVFAFLFIGRLIKDKGLIEYVQAAKILQVKYPEVQCQVLGAYYSGNPSAITKEQMLRWQEDGIVHYLGASDHVAPIIAQSDCVVLPSYREGLSRALLEAASMAKPIITTDTPGCRDVVDDGINGFLCKLKDAQDLAIQMKKMRQLELSQRIKMGNKGREKVINEFNEQLVIDKYSQAIGAILL